MELMSVGIMWGIFTGALDVAAKILIIICAFKYLKSR